MPRAHLVRGLEDRSSESWMKRMKRMRRMRRMRYVREAFFSRSRCRWNRLFLAGRAGLYRHFVNHHLHSVGEKKRTPLSTWIWF